MSALHEEIIAKLTEERDQARAWKAEQLKVESQWDPQRVGQLLELPLGASIRECLEPAIMKLIAQRDRAREKCLELDAQIWNEKTAKEQERARCTAMREAIRKAADQLKRGEWNSHNSGTWRILNNALEQQL